MKGSKKSSKKKKSKRKASAKSAELAEGAGGDGQGPEGTIKATDAASAAESIGRRMATRNMGAKHVPVGAVCSATAPDPRNYREAMRSERAVKWKVAMEEEIGALEDNETWELMKKPDRVKVLHSKWVFKTKKHADGSVERYKGRLVACGNEQSYGVDYTDTFSAVLDVTTGKVISHWPSSGGGGGAGAAWRRAKRVREGGQGGEPPDLTLRPARDGDQRGEARGAGRPTQARARSAAQEEPVRPQAGRPSLESAPAPRAHQTGTAVCTTSTMRTA
ncbi:hypothetical protein PF008_g22824 [Phytophthora fragariae]|uniref:Reverse transcriptase Ty1/copia-type domain-containing protein n=1 Tax=Phytophthora fragariae TaxID=53985 RepID=A0A6G0QSR7_9STRA|nr:hypothetical protein PF008_g22824 [Phytophthora fragariae]